MADFGDESGEFGAVLGEFGDDGGDAPDEHACVPREGACAEEFFGEVRVGFFAEALDFVDCWGVVEAGDEGAAAAFDVAVGRAGPCGADADGDDGFGAGGDFGCAFEAGCEGGVVFDELVCGEDHHDGVRAAGGDPADAEGDGWGGVAFGWFRDDVVCGDAVAHEHADGSDLFLVGEDEGIFRGDEAFEALDGLFEERVVTEELEELFGAGVAAERPETAAASACENDSVGFGHRRWVEG